MPLPKFEDWTPPWKEGEFDAEKAAKLIYNRLADDEARKAKLTEVTTSRDELQSKLTEYETKDLSELEKARRELDELKAKPPPQVDDLALARFEIALDKGLTKSQAKRLIGDSREALIADADAYIEEHGLTAGGDEPNDDGGPPTRRPRGRLQTGVPAGDDDPGTTDPAKLAGQLPPMRF